MQSEERRMQNLLNADVHFDCSFYNQVGNGRELIAVRLLADEKSAGSVRETATAGLDVAKQRTPSKTSLSQAPLAYIETNLQLIPIGLKYAIIPFPSLRPRYEFDVNFMRSGLNIDIEDAFVVPFRRFSPESVPVDQDSRGP